MVTTACICRSYTSIWSAWRIWVYFVFFIKSHFLNYFITRNVPYFIS